MQTFGKREYRNRLLTHARTNLPRTEEEAEDEAMRPRMSSDPEVWQKTITVAVADESKVKLYRPDGKVIVQERQAGFRPPPPKGTKR